MSNRLSNRRTCPECGTDQPLGLSPWLCPRCLLTSAASEPAEVVPRTPRLGRDSPLTHNGQAECLPRLLGAYELIERVGEGAMGVVYRARQLSLDRIVAVKILQPGLPADNSQALRFQMEAAAAGSLRHPNLVAIHEVGLWEGRQFLVMDFVEGPTLAALVRPGPLAPRRAARYVQIIAEAIHHAHEQGVLHRDLKPSNVLVDAQDQPRVVDFGLAKRLEGRLTEDGAALPDLPSLTLSGQVLGSPQYMSPEQAAGRHRQVGRRSDVYSLGGVLYHLLTGRAPFVGEALADILAQVATDEPLAPRRLNPAILPDLETLCLKCLEKEPGRRYPTALAVAEELARFQRNEPIQARPVGPVARAWRWGRRNPRLAGVGGLACLAFLLGFAGVTWEWHRAETGERSARLQSYGSDMYSAQQSIRANNLGRARELLLRHRPQPGTRREDLRSFEWSYLWQHCQGDTHELVGRLDSGVRSMDVSRDGTWLVAGGEQGGVRLWNLETREETLLSQSSRIQAFAAFSPDSGSVLFCDQTERAPGLITVWDLRTRKRAEPISNEWWVGPLMFSPDGGYFTYGIAHPPNNKKVVVLEYASRTVVGEVAAQTPIVDALRGFDWVITPDNRSIIGSETPDEPVAKFAGPIFMVDFMEGGPPRHFPGHGEPIVAMAISPDGRLLATAAGWTETIIKLWEVPTFQPVGEFVGHAKWVCGLQFSPDGQALASGSADETVRLWNVPTRRSTRVFRGHHQEVRRVCFSPDGRRLFSGSRDGEVLAWSLRAAPGPGLFWSASCHWDAIAFAPAGNRVAGLQQGSVQTAEAGPGFTPKPVPELGTNNTCLVFSSDGSTLFAGDDSGEVRAWYVPREEIVTRWRRSPDVITQLHGDRGSRRLVVIQNLKPPGVTRDFVPSLRIGVWDPSGGLEETSWTFPHWIDSCSLSPDGGFLAIAEAAGVVGLWNPGTAAKCAVLSFWGNASALGFSPDGRQIAAANAEGWIKIWDMKGWRVHFEFRALQRPVTAIAFSPDGRRLVSAGDGEEAPRLWDLATGQEVLTLERPGEVLEQVAFVADGRQLVARTAEGNVLGWLVPSLEEIEATESRIKR